MYLVVNNGTRSPRVLAVSSPGDEIPRPELQPFRPPGLPAPPEETQSEEERGERRLGSEFGTIAPSR